MIGVLEEERWPELADIFEKHWDSGLPTPGKADIIAEIGTDGSVQSFLVTEFLLRIGQVHGGGSNPRKLFRWVERHMPPGNAVIVVADEPRFEKLCELLKMRPMCKGQVYRKDF